MNGVSFKIPENSIFAILGPNGSGKSTLIRILANLITSWEGDISFKNNSIRNKENYINNFGFIVEDPSFYEYLSAKINLQILCRLTNSPFSRIEEVLSLVDLNSRKDELVSTYSYGMKQRLGIAQALLNPNLKLLIMDETLSNLDKPLAKKILEILEIDNINPYEDISAPVPHDVPGEWFKGPF